MRPEHPPEFPLAIHDLTVAYHRKPVLWDIELNIPQGTLAGIVGPNGAGKSTLLKACLDLIPKTSGEVLIYGKPYEDQRDLIAYVPQRESVDWDFPTTVFDLVLMGTYGRLGWFRWPGSAEKQDAKRALEMVSFPSTVEVVELMPPLIEWNRTFLVERNGPLLEDPRTKITQADLYDALSNKPNGSYDALLLDIDNTPDDLITDANARMYTPEFLQKLKNVLTPNGKLSYWLAEPAPRFKKTLEKAGFEVEAVAAKAHEKSKRARHCIYVCRKKLDPKKR